MPARYIQAIPEIARGAGFREFGLAAVLRRGGAPIVLKYGLIDYPAAESKYSDEYAARGIRTIVFCRDPSDGAMQRRVVYAPRVSAANPDGNERHEWRVRNDQEMLAVLRHVCASIPSGDRWIDIDTFYSTECSVMVTAMGIAHSAGFEDLRLYW